MPRGRSKSNNNPTKKTFLSRGKCKAKWIKRSRKTFPWESAGIPPEALGTKGPETQKSCRERVAEAVLETLGGNEERVLSTQRGEKSRVREGMGKGMFGGGRPCAERRGTAPFCATKMEPVENCSDGQKFAPRHRRGRSKFLT